MRLPHSLTSSQFFNFSSLQEFLKALPSSFDSQELVEINRVSSLNLPPVTSRHALATMLGVNPSLIWSFQYRKPRYYRTFVIPKGRAFRTIHAPKVGLKIIQKWLSIQLQSSFTSMDHVFGFVPGKSHIEAAAKHCGARWIISVDIKDFFSSTPVQLVYEKLLLLGFSVKGAELLADLFCYDRGLAQGAPSSPVMSNICFNELDIKLYELAQLYGAVLTRYADDIVFSGRGDLPQALNEDLTKLFQNSPWVISERKRELSQFPDRLKVHGIIVSGQQPRLTKGYRNKIRAYRHLLNNGRISNDDLTRIRGHINYSNHVESIAQLIHP